MEDERRTCGCGLRTLVSFMSDYFLIPIRWIDAGTDSLISLFTTYFIVLYDDRDLGDHESPPNRRVGLWATFLGVSSTLLCAIQYAPQIYRTWHAKTVGSLSLLMMCIQTPGAVLMVLSIALR